MCLEHKNSSQFELDELFSPRVALSSHYCCCTESEREKEREREGQHNKEQMKPKKGAKAKQSCSNEKYRTELSLLLTPSNVSLRSNRSVSMETLTHELARRYYLS